MIPGFELCARVPSWGASLMGMASQIIWPLALTVVSHAHPWVRKVLEKMADYMDDTKDFVTGVAGVA
jgi:hypothetical protein